MQFGSNFISSIVQDFVIAMTPETHPRQPACLVSRLEGLNQFEAAFIDPWNRTITTKTFFLYEPVVFQAAHHPHPMMTHIAFIAKDYFVVGVSTTDRMIPVSQAQKVRTCFIQRSTCAHDEAFGRLDQMELSSTTLPYSNLSSRRMRWKDPPP